MPFEFTPDQYEFHTAARELLEKECTASDLRAYSGGEQAWPSERWRRMAGVGLTGLLVPEGHGGLGMNETDMVLILEEVGRVALPEPLVDSSAIATPVLLAGADESTLDKWLPSIARGDVTAAIRLPSSPLVADADNAGLLLYAEKDGVRVIPRGDYEVVRQPSMDETRRLFKVTHAPDAGIILDGGAALSTEMVDRAAAASAAVLNGVSKRLLEMSHEYVQARHQFGRPIGSFQAMKHKLADMLLLTESSRSAAWYAAYTIQEALEDRMKAVSVAKAYASDAHRRVNQEALQSHGGIGFTIDHDLHLWLRRGKALERAYGSARWHRQRLAEAVVTGVMSQG